MLCFLLSQLKYIRGREENIKEGRLPFLRDRDNIVQDLIAKVRLQHTVLSPYNRPPTDSQRSSHDERVLRTTLVFRVQAIDYSQILVVFVHDTL